MNLERRRIGCASVRLDLKACSRFSPLVSPSLDPHRFFEYRLSDLTKEGVDERERKENVVALTVVGEGVDIDWGGEATDVLDELRREVEEEHRAGREGKFGGEWRRVGERLGVVTVLLESV
jgi:hypothetical protein